jgi:hypothetical protein
MNESSEKKKEKINRIIEEGGNEKEKNIIERGARK